MAAKPAREAIAATIEVRLLAWIMSREAARSLDEAFGAFKVDVTGLQYGILRMLREESATLSELSRKFMLDPSTLVPVIDDLVKKGYVKRQRDPNDRRRMPLIVTDKGLSLIARVPEQHTGIDRFGETVLQLGEEKSTRLRELMREFVGLLPDGDAMLQHVQARCEALVNAHVFEDSPADDSSHQC